MDLDQLTGRYERLKAELASAYAQDPWPTGRIDRLTEEISAAELAIAAMGSQAQTVTSRDIADSLSADASAATTSAGKPTTRRPAVARTRLTPFGAPAPQPAGE